MKKDQYFGELEFFASDYLTKLSVRALKPTCIMKISLLDFLEYVHDLPIDNENYCYIKDSILFKNDYS